MKKIFTGEEQARDTFITTLVKLFDIERYDVMEKFCDELEISFKILNESQVNPNEYFEYLNTIKFEIMEEYRNYFDNNSDDMNVEIQHEDAMDMDNSSPKINLSKLLEEANTIEPSDSNTLFNPIYNLNFYIIYLLVLIINNQMNSARYLYKRLPKPVLKNRTISFIKSLLSCLLEKDVGKALSILNKEIEIEINIENENTEKEEVILEEEIIEKTDKKLNKEVDNESDYYEIKKEEVTIADNTPEQSSDTIELLISLLEKIRCRQINLMSKAYDHILIKEAAKNLNFTEEKAISYLTSEYGWKVDSENIMFIPKHEIIKGKQEMSINHIDTLIDHLIFLEGSDKLLKVEHF
ncbi:hypothetical protein BCR36DRAFT_412817 [Piromyces finnis]|uniref:CSN8/PSMD8/EIF3K domain-containing protein n=1 Tax=Piromyces finnis TaxID=1754191 RepID=A0A1Y1V7Q8_9FUNG|nr:hypothetical protein BCR36DRAFT_412817 [Piromyces finnis]|eukprot:ORX49297.1 hypothetical protein BCR36DRAFT_412817 [Piromyces finnis]